MLCFMGTDKLPKFVANILLQNAQRISNFLNHPCPGYVLLDLNYSLELQSAIKSYVIDEIDKEREKFFYLSPFLWLNKNKTHFELDEFLALIQEDKVPDATDISLSVNYFYHGKNIIEKEDKFKTIMSKLREILISDNCPEQLDIDMEKLGIRNQGFEVLMELLLNAKTVKKLSLNLDKNNITYIDIENFYKVLSSGVYDEFSISFNENWLITNNFVNNLVDSFAIGAPQKFSFKSRHLELTCNQVIKLNQAISAGYCPKEFDFNFHNGTARNQWLDLAYSYAKALDSGYFPSKMGIALAFDEDSLDGLYKLLEVMSAEKCKHGLEFWVSLYGHRPTQDGIIANAKNIQNDKFPTNSKIQIFHKEVISELASLAVGEALMSNKCPSGLEINFKLKNDSGDDDDELRESIHPIYKALASGHCPSDLIISYSANSTNCKKIINYVLSDGLKLNRWLGVERIVALNQGYKQTTSLSSLPQEIFYHIIGYVEPRFTQEVFDKIARTVDNRNCYMVPKFSEHFRKLFNISNHIRVSHDESKITISFDQIDFKDYSLLVKTLKEEGFEDIELSVDFKTWEKGAVVFEANEDKVLELWALIKNRVVNLESKSWIVNNASCIKFTEPKDKDIMKYYGIVFEELLGYCVLQKIECALSGTFDSSLKLELSALQNTRTRNKMLCIKIAIMRMYFLVRKILIQSRELMRWVA